INTRLDVAEVERILAARIRNAHMLNGVGFSLPETTIVEPDVQIESDAHIEPGCILRGHSFIGAGATVGPYTTLVGTRVERGATVARAECIEAFVGPGASVGPFAYLRPGTTMREGSKVGTFVELKNTTLGQRSKVPHLSYVGDATVGTDSNIGAGNITANYRP